METDRAIIHEFIDLFLKKGGTRVKLLNLNVPGFLQQGGWL